MTPSVHIALSETPLEAGVEQHALCGAVIAHAAWLWTSTEPARRSERARDFFASYKGDVWDQLAAVLCRECWLADWEGKYVYALVSGEWVK